MTEELPAEALPEDLFLGRQPILDDKQEVVGYELLFRAGMENHAEVGDGRLATATVACAAFAQLGMADALGHYLAFINVDTAFLFEDPVEMLPVENVVFDIDINRPLTGAELDRCQALRQRGYRVCLGGFGEPNSRYKASLAQADFIKIDIGAVAPEQLAPLARMFADQPGRLLAVKVETSDDATRCATAGFHLFQGYYFARPTVVRGRKLSPSLQAVIHTINLLQADADVGAVESAIKHQAALTINLLRLVNSVSFGLSRRVDSVRHAITVVGQRQLTRWLQLLLVAGNAAGSNCMRNPLLQLAALRGRLLELLARRRYADERALGEMGFITGVMSVMPAALGMPIDEILEQVSVADPVRDALLERHGRLGGLLQLVDSYDENDVAACDAQLAKIGGGLNRQVLNAMLTEALGWMHGLDAV